MKTLTPTNLIAVEVPKDAKMELKHFSRAGFWLFDANSKELNCFKVNIPKDKNGNILFEILGEVIDTEISFDVEPYLEKSKLFEGCFKIFPIEDENPEVGSKDDAFYSLLWSNGLYFENPMKFPSTVDPEFYDEPYDGTGFYQELYSGAMVDWQSYESKLIKGKLIILKQK